MKNISILRFYLSEYIVGDLLQRVCFNVFVPNSRLHVIAGLSHLLKMKHPQQNLWMVA